MGRILYTAAQYINTSIQQSTNLLGSAGKKATSMGYSPFGVAGGCWGLAEVGYPWNKFNNHHSKRRKSSTGEWHTALPTYIRRLSKPTRPQRSEVHDYKATVRRALDPALKLVLDSHRCTAIGRRYQPRSSAPRTFRTRSQSCQGHHEHYTRAFRNPKTCSGSPSFSGANSTGRSVLFAYTGAAPIGSPLQPALRGKCAHEIAPDICQHTQQSSALG